MTLQSQKEPGVRFRKSNINCEPEDNCAVILRSSGALQNLHVFAGREDVFYQLHIVKHQSQTESLWKTVKPSEDVQGRSKEC